MEGEGERGEERDTDLGGEGGEVGEGMGWGEGERGVSSLGGCSAVRIFYNKVSETDIA